MKLTIGFVLVSVVVYGGATDKNHENTSDILKAPFGAGISGFGLEILLTKLNYIDRKLMELQLKVDQHREQTESNNTSHEKTLTATTTTTTVTTSKSQQPTLASCKDAPADISGVYPIRVKSDSTPFFVYCEQEKYEGGWIVLQHRFDGSVDFYRNWKFYRNGFGELDSEFWLGLEHIHQITTARKHELIVEMKDFDHIYGYARYSAFEIGSESEHYRLKSLGSFRGTAGDSMAYSNGKMFSTKDRDNDADPNYHWAVHYEGAWWYGFRGSSTNLNGPFGNAVPGKSIWWLNYKNNYRGIRFTRMMIRELKQ